MCDLPTPGGPKTRMLAPFSSPRNPRRRAPGCAPRDGGLNPGSLRVSGHLLPAHPAVCGDELEMTVARVGAVSAVVLDTPSERGGTMTAASGCRAATSP